MVDGSVMFSGIVAVVGFSGGPIVVKLVLNQSTSKPVVFHVHCFQFFMMLLFTTPRAVVLLVCIGVGGCLWPKNLSVCHDGIASPQLM